MSDYRISDTRIADIIASDERLAEFSPVQVGLYCVADWPEGEEHQVWLDTAPAAEIASWVYGGLLEIKRSVAADEELPLPDPFASEPPSTDPARDEANLRELARQARRLHGER